MKPTSTSANQDSAAEANNNPVVISSAARDPAAGSTTWYGLARAVFAEAGLDPERVRPTTSDRFRRPARRPAYSVLGHDRWSGTGVAPLPDWRAMLAEAMPVLLR